MRPNIQFFLPVLILLFLSFPACSVGVEAAQVAPMVQQRAKKDIVEHHSFSPPILQNYYIGGELPFWSIRGSTVVTDDYVRLTPDALEEAGSIWNRHPLTMPEFDIIMGVSILKKNGGDGLALWVIQEGPDTIRPERGKIHGHSSAFAGFAIILDTFDNNGRRDNPTVGLLFNNGDPKKKFDPSTDYINDYIASCVFDFRSPNKKFFSTVRVHVTHGSVSVFLSKMQGHEELHCFTVDDLFLDVKKNMYHIGITAATGGLSQEHDVVFLHTLPLQNVKYDHDVHIAKEEPENSEPQETTSEIKESRSEDEPETKSPSTDQDAAQERLKELEREVERLKKLASKEEEKTAE